MKSIMIVGGTRPEAIKLAPVMEALDKAGTEYIHVWSGQHYDYAMSGIFFDELGMPKPHENLEVGSGSHAEQTARIMLGLEKLISKYSPSVVVVEGDTNTVAAASITSVKCMAPLAHVEAGLRSWNITMPEEINRKISGAVATLNFAPTKQAVINLLFEGVSPKRIHLTGNTIVDVLQKHSNMFVKKGENLLDKLKIGDGFILVTLHRAENQSDPERLGKIVTALERLSKKYTVIFPIHPGMRKRVNELGLSRRLQGVRVIEPLGYFEFLGLLSHCKTVLTDSGGVQEEAFTLKVPAVTVRYNTERPETTLYELNKLSGADPGLIVKLVEEQVNYSEEAKRLRVVNPLGDGNAGVRIAKILKKAVQEEIALGEPDLRDKPAITYSLVDRELRIRDLYEAVIGFKKNGEPDPSMEDCVKLLVRVKKRLGEEDLSDVKSCRGSS